ncbi:hypothetical protein EDB83DRAFT_2452639 [Lactarius deliciosus]|nr:hypothetical protein EDB83DRAFT_2452639 [Lactarius deliciosus]
MFKRAPFRCLSLLESFVDVGAGTADRAVGRVRWRGLQARYSRPESRVYCHGGGLKFVKLKLMRNDMRTSMKWETHSRCRLRTQPTALSHALLFLRN